MTDKQITISIPVELSAACVIRAGHVKDEAVALQIARELHDVVAAYVRMFRNEPPHALVRLPDDPEGEPIEVEPARKHNALEIADFALALWRHTFISHSLPDSPDYNEGCWCRFPPRFDPGFPLRTDPA
jgi:hypothetical protein